MDSTKPTGKRFTAVYRERGAPTDDSIKFRNRVAHKIHHVVDDYSVIKALRAETGWSITSAGGSAWWVKFIADLSRDQLLDFLTTVTDALYEVGLNAEAAEYIAFVQRSLDEENLGFVMDDEGGVHYRIDEAFQDGRIAAIAVLGLPNSVAAKLAFEDAQRALTGHPSDTLLAVRRAFDAVENLFKIRYGTSRLGASEIKSAMSKIGDGKGGRTGDAARRLNAAFGEWVNACHQYRHAPGEPDPSPPPRWLAVALVDGAATYIRYLASDAVSD